MKKTLKYLFGAACLFGTALTSSGVTLLADDFDGNSVGALNPSGSIGLSTVVDPTDAGNMVGQVEFTGGGEWQSLASGTSYDLPAGTVAGTDDLNFTFRVYVPSAGVATVGTNFNDADSFNSLFRLNGTAPDSYPPSVQNPIVGAPNFPLDEWVTISNGGVIPEVDNTDPFGPVTSVELIWSIRNINPDGPTGLLGYVDDVAFTMTESVPEPSVAVLGALGMLGLIRRRR